MRAAEWFVKARKAGDKRFRFVAPEGRLTTLRLHASRWTDRTTAENALAALAAGNPEFEFRVQPAETRRASL
jgi:hypothetical protein